MATFYFNGAVDSNWDTLGNWWTDNNHTIPALALPTSSDSAIISYGIDSGNEPTILNLTVNGAYISTITITVTGNAIFNLGSSLRQSAQLNGNVTFNGASFIDGTGAVVVGDVIFNTGSFNGGYIDGNATFNGDSYNQATIDGNATFNNSSYNNVLDSISGTITVGGIREWEGTWWINNVQTTLRTSPGGVGLWNNSFYRNSVVYAGPSTIYVRTSGNDSNEGTETSPLASAQVAFEMAFFGSSGNKIIDFGVGDFGGIVLSQDWPSRIAVRGVNSSQSLFGGINGNGLDEIVDYENNTLISEAIAGKNINISSNKTINLGNITSNGNANVSTLSNGSNAGSITIDNAIFEDINAIGGPSDFFTNVAGNSGSIIINNSSCGNIFIDGGNGYSYNGSNGGSLLLENSTCLDIAANGGYGTNPGLGGSITLNNSTSSNISVDGGISEHYGDGQAAGSVTLNDSSCGSISGQGGDMGTGGSISAGGTVTLNNSSSGNIDLAGGTGSEDPINGIVTLTGSSIIPNEILNVSQVICTNLNKGRGINGSSILGVV
jgi:hypothetical protein